MIPTTILCDNYATSVTCIFLSILFQLLKIEKNFAKDEAFVFYFVFFIEFLINVIFDHAIVKMSLSIYLNI